MDWSNVGTKLAQIGLPLLGAALPIPGGAAIGRAMATFVTGNHAATPEQTIAALNDPVAQEKAREFYAQNQTAILQAQLAAETAQIESVNATMRTEADSKNWPTWTWRPFIGFVFGTMCFGDYFILPLLGIESPKLPQEMFVAFMAILGVASWGHSMALKDPTNSINKG